MKRESAKIYDQGAVDNFLARKTKIAEYLEREKENELFKDEEALDDEMRELVKAFNRLPFLYTTGSYDGCLEIKKNAGPGWKNFKENEAITNKGYINFKIDNSPKSQDFVKKLEEFNERNYEFAELEFVEGDDQAPEKLREFYSLYFGISSGRPIDIKKAQEIEAEKKRFEDKLKEFVSEFL